jgi:hypothetical protein
MVGVQAFTNTKSWYQTISRGHYDRTFCGLPADVDFAEWLIEALTQFVQGELANFLMTCGEFGIQRRVASRSFVMGCTSRIGDRLKELATPAPTKSSNSRALVVTKQAAIDDCMKCNGIKLRSAGYSAGAGDDDAYSAGRAAGDRASFGRPVSGGTALRLGK